MTINLLNKDLIFWVLIFQAMSNFQFGRMYMVLAKALVFIGSFILTVAAIKSF